MDFRQRAKDLVSKMTLAEKCAQLRHDAPAIEHLGVPEYNWWNECLHGVARAGVATVFPQAIGMAASFDPELINEVATAISNEARGKHNEFKKKGSTGYYEGLTFWTPNINIFRDPRWGRGHETYGEDPYLTGTLGSAFIKGLQDGDDTYRKLDATIKHYVVHSGPEGVRHSFDAKVGKKDFYETYLRAFKACIENADPSALMGAYNRVSVEGICEGEPCCGSEALLQKILYGDLGFNGYIVSDCGAINDFHMHHKVTNNAAESAALALNNGCTLNCGTAYRALLAAVDAGLVTEEVITKSVEDLFYARFRLGMFDEDCPYNSISYDVVDCEKHKELNLKVAENSVVVLKNNGILPLSKDSGKSIAVIGPNGDDLQALIGNYSGTASEYVTVVDGIREVYAKNGKVRFTPGGHLYKPYNKNACGENLLSDAEVIASKSDIIILVMGLNALMEGEDGDAYNGAASGDKIDLELPRSQYQIYDRVIKLGKPVIFINIAGSAMNLSRQDEECDAVIHAFYPGAMGGRAIASILFGDANPTGRLPVTFYRSDSDLPAFDDYSMKNRTYKYFEGTPLYPFGHGLTYTNFCYEKISAPAEAKAGENIKISVSVKNNSKYNGKESILVFAKYPGIENAPKKLLCALGKITLNAGESGEAEIEIKANDLALYDDNGTMIYPAGKIVIEIGKISASINLK